MPRGEGSDHDPGIGSYQRRSCSSVSRTCADVSGGTLLLGTAVSDLPLPFKRIGVGGRPISRRPSLTCSSSSWPGRKPRRSRIALGTTSRPAESMVIFVPKSYRQNGTSARTRAGHRKWQERAIARSLLACRSLSGPSPRPSTRPVDGASRPGCPRCCSSYPPRPGVRTRRRRPGRCSRRSRCGCPRRESSTYRR